MIEKYQVSLKRPDGVTKTEMKRYIADAVGSWKGSLRAPGSHDPYDEGDPLFSLDADTIKVTFK